MQIASVETNAGMAICAAPSRIARRSGLFMPKLRWTFSSLHGGVVHEDADRQRHAAQRHGVERLAQCPQDDDRREDRQRDRDGDDERASPRAEEQQDHQRRQPGRDRPFLEHALDGRPDEDRLIEEQVHLQLGRQLGLDAGQRRADRWTTLRRGGAFALEDGHQHGPAAVAADDVGLHHVAHAHVGHVLDVDRHAVDRLDRDVVESGDQVGAAVELDVIFRVADLGGAGRDDQVLVVDGRLDVLWRQAAGVQLRPGRDRP